MALFNSQSSRRWVIIGINASREGPVTDWRRGDVGVEIKKHARVLLSILVGLITTILIFEALPPPRGETTKDFFRWQMSNIQN